MSFRPLTLPPVDEVEVTLVMDNNSLHKTSMRRLCLFNV